MWCPISRRHRPSVSFFGHYVRPADVCPCSTDPSPPSAAASPRITAAGPPAPSAGKKDLEHLDVDGPASAMLHLAETQAELANTYAPQLQWILPSPGFLSMDETRIESNPGLILD